MNVALYVIVHELKLRVVGDMFKRERTLVASFLPSSPGVANARHQPRPEAAGCMPWFGGVRQIADACSFDYAVGALQERGRKGYAQLLGGSGIHDELIASRVFKRQVRRRRAL